MDSDPKFLALGHVTFDAIEYASRANAILGLRDSGKSYTAQVIAEQLMDQDIPIIALDGIGRWKYMRYPSQKRETGGQGYPVVVAGGPNADLHLTPDNAAQITRAALQSGVSLVLDLFQRELSKADWRKIVRQACEVLLHENEGHGLRHLFLEEAHEYVPQKVRDGLVYSAVEKLIQMGGNVGVGGTMIAHRAADTNKSVLELCENLILHAQTGKLAIEGLQKWLTAGAVDPPKEITDTLSTLPTGEAWVWLRGKRPERIRIQPKRSFDANRRELAAVKSTLYRPAAAVGISEFIQRMKAALEGKPQPKHGRVVADKIISSKTRWPGKEDEVDKATADRLTVENAALKRRVATERTARRQLDDALATIRNLNGGAPDPDMRDIEAIYRMVKQRLVEDAPALLKVLTVKPEIEVTVERRTVEMNGDTPKGRFARLIATGFFDTGATNSGIRTELKRTGADVSNPSISKFCDEFTIMGFLTRDGSTYIAVPDMKVNIVEKP